MKLTKTEIKLLTKLEKNGWRTGYDGKRESNAARKLEEKGFVRRQRGDGWYQHRNWDGSYSRRYHPQGIIYTIESGV